MNIVIFGPPGAGKGTQSNYIANKFKLHQLSTGDLLRKEIKDQTKLGNEHFCLSRTSPIDDYTCRIVGVPFKSDHIMFILLQRTSLNSSIREIKYSVERSGHTVWKL